jgi:hypothetical protein
MTEARPETWEKADAKLKGGGAVWRRCRSMWLKRRLCPGGNPAPDFFGEARPENLYTCSMIALDVRPEN